MTRSMRSAWLVIGVLLCSGVARAGEWTVDDVVGGEAAGELAMSPDGAWGAWSQSEVVTLKGEASKVSSIRLARLDAGTTRQLTRGVSSAWSPKFSPDSTFVAFLSDRGHPTDEDAASTQVWVIPVDGGEARCVTDFARDIEGFEWAAGDTMVVLASEGKALRETTLDDADDDSIVVESPDDEPRTRLFAVDIESGETRRITENTGWIQSFSISPDGTRAVVIENTSLSSEFDDKVRPRLMMVDLETGGMTRLMAEDSREYYAIAWSPDDAGFYFEYLHSTHLRYRMMGVSHLAFYDFASGNATVINGGIDKGYIYDIDPYDGGVHIVYEDGTRSRVARIDRRGQDWETLTFDLTPRGSVHELACAPRSHAALLVSTSSAVTPETISSVSFIRNVTGTREFPQLTPIAELNQDWRDRDMGRVESIWWEGARGERVEGVLHYPIGYESDKKYPLILAPHGGPLGASLDEWTNRWSYPTLAWRERGAFVLEPNYHGSSGYGIEFAESLADGNYLTIDVEDCERGVDHLIAQGLVDSDRLAISGWSNGAILGAALITRSTRWKAACLGAGDVEFISDWGNVDFGAAFDNYFFGGPPWEQLDMYIERSAFFRLDGVTTPTIVLTGTEDRNVPPSQSWSLFRALQQIGKAPTRLVLFPGEPHGLRKIAHQRRKVEEELAWLDRYLFNNAEPTNDALDESAPLAHLREIGRAASLGGCFGELNGGALIPEFVEFGSVRVSRFEITNAQWAAFDGAFRYPPDMGDYPVTGVGFDRAMAYAAWLATALNEPVRLMTVDESDALADAADAWGSGGGNTLDYWAGYGVTPDDRERLAPVLSELRPGALLQRVGSMPGSGEAGVMVFDLDGNAAEWATDESGRGVITGPSADRPGDARDRRPTDDPVYVGFRVVIGA
ncbi:MAG: prolyl oligopeptidase family serine peptidase [Phycisphaerales bacterium]|nr:prolyl oligopeptidase family serine peptidase [Phycisphaerales bacterium]